MACCCSELCTKLEETLNATLREKFSGNNIVTKSVFVLEAKLLAHITNSLASRTKCPFLHNISLNENEVCVKEVVQCDLAMQPGSDVLLVLVLKLWQMK